MADSDITVNISERFVLRQDFPVNPQSGRSCVQDPVNGVWRDGDFSISVKDWEIVRLHVTTLDRLMSQEGIYHIIYGGTPIPAQLAVNTDHLFGAFIDRAKGYGAVVGLEPIVRCEAFDPALVPVVEEFMLLPYYYLPDPSVGSFSESLRLLAMTVRDAVLTFREDHPDGTAMDIAYLWDRPQAQPEPDPNEQTAPENEPLQKREG